ncbi:putative ribonuclease H-like domain-containing protein [Tanacetum coccineum]
MNQQTQENLIHVPIRRKKKSVKMQCDANYGKMLHTLNHLPKKLVTVNQTQQLKIKTGQHVNTAIPENSPSIAKALSDSSWVEAIQEELLQFKLQQQVEGIDYEEVFAHVARIKAIRLFLAYASFMGFLVYQMDVKSAFLYGTIEEEVYVTQPPGFKDHDHPDKVYKVVKALYGLHQAPRAWHVKRGRDTKIPQSSGPPVKVGDEAVHKELGDRMERAATTASSLEAEQDSGSGPRCQDTILGDVDAQTRFETTSKQSNDPPLSRGYTLGSGEDSMKLLELMELCTKLSKMLHKNRKSDLVSQKK